MDITKLSAGELPDKVNVFIEIPRGSSVKYELDKKSGCIFVDRFLPSAMYFPFNYGFIPHTLGEDGDPLDVVVLCEYSLITGSVIPCRPIGMLEMEDEAGIDTKIIAVPGKKNDPFYAYLDDINDLRVPEKNRIKHFFDRYKDMQEDKWVKTKDFLGKDKAVEAIKAAMK